VKVNGKLCYLWRAVDHEGEVLEAVVTARRDKAAALKLLKRIMKKYGAPRSIVTDGLRAYSAAMNEIGVAAERHKVGYHLNNRAENSHQPFRRRERAMQRFREDAAEVQLSSRPGPQPIQSGAPSRHEAGLQAETLCCLGRVARPCGVDRRSTFRLMCEPRIALTAPHISRSAPMIRRFIDAARVGRAAYDITSPRTGSSSLPCLRRPHELQVSTMPWRRSFCGLAGPVLFRARLRYGLQRRANNRQIVVRTLPLTTKSTVSA